jgi:hypothetical protein
LVGIVANIAGDATETVDARGKIVAPGLIDIHTHAGRSKEGPELLLQLRHRPQHHYVRISERQFNRPPPRCHYFSILRVKAPDPKYRNLRRRMNPPLMTTFMESIV